MLSSQMVQAVDSTQSNNLYIAFELSNKKWKLIFSNGSKRRQKTIEAGDLFLFEEELGKAKSKFKMADDVPVYSCYEAGRDGFWIHRYLNNVGINNSVVDSASIEVNRKYRRAKTDRLDVIKLLNKLISYHNGETDVWSVVRVPSVEQEDARRIDREIQRLKKERASHTNRIKSLLVLHGIKLNIKKSFLRDLEESRLWDKTVLPEKLKNEILREYRRFEVIQTQLKELEDEKKQMLAADDKQAKQVKALQHLKGIGPVSSWCLIYEFFGWRKFKNVKEVGAASGLAPTPYDSGDSVREQGISKAGNRRIRSLMVELAWSWLRYQPQSKLSEWFLERFAKGGSRMRRIGIVALARKLLVALWKYLQTGLVPKVQS